MKLGKHAVKVLAVFAVLFVVGFALKFLNLHEGFVTIGSGNNANEILATDYEQNQRRNFLKNVRSAATERGITGNNTQALLKGARNEATAAGLKFTREQRERRKARRAERQ